MDPRVILAKYGLNPPEDYAWFDAEVFEEGKDYSTFELSRQVN